jgi:hypothetical protein
MTDPKKELDLTADEERLLADLARLVRQRDAVPPALVEMARETFTWGTVDTELAELVADSQHSETAALVRSPAASARLLAFAAGGLRLDLEVLADVSSRSLVGELDPASSARITVEHPAGSLTEESDELGRFVFDRVPRAWSGSGASRRRAGPCSHPG